jgi:hypothetical protein
MVTCSTNSIFANPIAFHYSLKKTQTIILKMKLYHELTPFYGSKRKEPFIIQGWQGMWESEKDLQ